MTPRKKERHLIPVTIPLKPNEGIETIHGRLKAPEWLELEKGRILSHPNTEAEIHTTENGRLVLLATEPLSQEELILENELFGNVDFMHRAKM